MINKLTTLTFQIEIYKFESKSGQIWNAHEKNIYSYWIFKVKNLIDKAISLILTDF